MKLRNIALAAAAASALVLESAALAQEEKKPEPATKPQAKDQHRGERGMSRMREMRDGCHGESQGKPAGEHRHS